MAVIYTSSSVIKPSCLIHLDRPWADNWKHMFRLFCTVQVKKIKPIASEITLNKIAEDNWVAIKENAHAKK